MIFHKPQKKIDANIEIIINKSKIEQVKSFNFLGINIDQHLNWKSHTDKVHAKLSQTMGVLNKLKRLLPIDIKKMLYNSLILPL